jgi:beta-1,4-mannosyl-glycoprotein beta-1,4-N-acetylglucosaminyltransferase
MKIIDCFIFYNELDLLKYRLHILNNFVDYFVIIESRHTFSGKEKKLYYDDNKKSFEIYKDKIIHIIIDDMPFKLPFINISKNEQWENEYYQRKSIRFEHKLRSNFYQKKGYI